MNKKIFYWAPFFSNIATIKAVLNSAISIKKFSKKEFVPTIINVFGEWDEFKEKINKHEIEIVELNLNKYFKKKKINGFIKSRYYQIKIFILAFFPLLNLIKTKKPDVFILHLITSLPLFLNFIFNIDSKIILRISGLPKLNIIRKVFWYFALNKVNMITAPTIATKDYLKKIFKKSDISLLRDPILNVEKIKLKKISKNRNEKKFLAIGRLTKQKNFIFLFESFKILIQQNPKIYLYILGDGEEYEKLNDFINKNNLQNNIFLEGYRSNVYEYLSNSDAFILSSLWEDPGFVLIEAAYANTTIISSNCFNGPSEILEGGKNGFLFKSNDKDDFLNVFSKFENSNSSIINQKKIDSKKMSRKYSLFSHFLELKKLF